MTLENEKHPVLFRVVKFYPPYEWLYRCSRKYAPNYPRFIQLFFT